MRRDRVLRQHLRERFVITLLSGETFDGLLDRWDDSTLEFVDAFAVTERARLQVDGRLFLPRPQIAYMQRPDGR
jgi:hypothetical protein